MTRNLSRITMLDRLFLPAMIMVSLLTLSPTVAPAKDLDVDMQMGGRKLRAAFQPVVSEARKSTVEIWCGSKHVAMGVVLDNEGHILTKASELQSNITCRFFDETEVRAKFVAADREFDLALLDVEHDKLTPIQWASEDLDKIGRWVVTAGIEESPVAVGMSSVNSIDIPKERGKAWLGIEMDVATERPKIQSIRPFSSASRSGLRTGDVILQVSDSIVESRDHMISALSKFTPGDSLFVRVLRGRDYKNFQITLDSRGKDTFHRQAIQNRMGANLSNRRAGFVGVMQHDTVMSSHDCGGPLLNLDGEAIGLNIARGGRTESYAIPASVLKKRIEELESGRLAVILPMHMLPETEYVSSSSARQEVELPEPPPLPEK